MSKNLDLLQNQYDRKDQGVKRDIGKYIHDRPGRWISKKKIVDWSNLDESGVQRHLEDFHEDGFIITKIGDDDQLYAKWNGRGSGGISYYTREIIPPELIAAAKEIRPILTLDSIGGAYLTTLVFGILLIIGLATASFTAVVYYTPGDAAFGITVFEALVLTGIVTVAASVFMLFIPVGIILEKIIEWILDWISNKEENKEPDENS